AYRYRDGVIHMVASYGLGPAGLREVQRVFPRPASDDTIVGSVILTRQPALIRDVEREEGVPALSRGMIQALETRSQVTIPMLRAGEPIGVMTLGWTEPEAFDEQKIALLQTFADQAVIAVENVRLLTELEARNRALTEALEQQTATSDILRVISRSPNDVQPVFDSIAASALRLCDAKLCTTFTFDGELIHLVASHHVTEEGAAAYRDAYPSRPGRASGTHRAILTRTIVHIPDIREDREYELRALARANDYGCVLAVPMLRDGHPVGVITVGREAARPFPSEQIELLKTFADQAVIAIENVRLFTELQEKNRALTAAHAQVSESLEQQTATSEVLRVISSSPTDLQPVFDSIAASALRLCDAKLCTAFRFDGELIHLVGSRHVSEEGAAAYRDAYPSRPGRQSGTHRAILTRTIVHIPDIREDAEYELGALARANDYGCVLSVPMLRDGHPVGAITVGREAARPFTNAQIELLKTFADQAVIAIENVRLFKELEEKNSAL